MTVGHQSNFRAVDGGRELSGVTDTRLEMMTFDSALTIDELT